MSSKLPRSTRRDVLLGGTSLLVMTPHVARGQGTEPVRFSLEFRIYGGNAPLFLGAESGIFRDQGINCTGIDQPAKSTIRPPCAAACWSG